MINKIIEVYISEKVTNSFMLYHDINPSTIHLYVSQGFSQTMRLTSDNVRVWMYIYGGELSAYQGAKIERAMLDGELSGANSVKLNEDKKPKIANKPQEKNKKSEQTKWII